MLILSFDTVLNRPALRLRRVPERRLGRGFKVVPRGTILSGLFWRVFLDQGFPRYLLALTPFPIAMFLRPDLALAISQAPLLMFALVYAVENQVLTVSNPRKRKALLPPEEVARRLDRLSLGARDCLTQLAAGRQMTGAVIHLVVEQSPLRHVPLLSVVSVQVVPEEGKPYMLDPSADEREMIAQRLFAHGVTEEELHLANTVDNKFLRDITLEARAISAHARLLAMARA